MKYLKIFLFCLVPLSVLVLAQNANGILVGDGREESDVILVGNVLSFVENKTSLETSYLVGVEKYLKTPKNYDTNTKTVTVISPGLRQYDEPQQAMVYEKLFNINDRVLFLLYQKDDILRESLYSQTTKSNCSPKQLLDEMYGEYSLHISQNNQTRYFYTNQPIDLIYYGYNLDLMAEKKDFEFKVNVPKTGQILSEKTHLDFQACKRTALASWSFTPTVAGRYTFHSIIGNNEGGSQSFSGFLIEDYVESPFKQFQTGIHPEDVKCRESLILVTKYDGFPACIKPESYAKLILRGWASVPKYIPGEMPKGIEIPDDVDIKEFERVMIENKTIANISLDKFPLWYRLSEAERIVTESFGKLPITGVGIDIHGELEITIHEDELKKIPNATEYYEQLFKDMIPYEIPIKIEFGHTVPVGENGNHN